MLTSVSYTLSYLELNKFWQMSLLFLYYWQFPIYLGLKPLERRLYCVVYYCKFVICLVLIRVYCISLCILFDFAIAHPQYKTRMCLDLKLRLFLDLFQRSTPKLPFSSVYFHFQLIFKHFLSIHEINWHLANRFPTNRPCINTLL